MVVAAALLASVLVVALRGPGTASPADRVAAVGSAQTTLESLLSYDYKTFDDHVAQVEPQLTGTFLTEFTSNLSQLKTLAAQNQTVVQARVYNVGVMDSTSSGTVRVLAFLNQGTTTKAQPDPQIDQNRVIATMSKVGNRWLVSGLDAF